MIIDAQCLPGTREEVLDDAFDLAAWGHRVKFWFQGELVIVEPEGVATFYSNPMVIYDRRLQRRRGRSRHVWVLRTANAQPGAEPNPPDGKTK